MLILAPPQILKCGNADDSRFRRFTISADLPMQVSSLRFQIPELLHPEEQTAQKQFSRLHAPDVTAVHKFLN